MTCDQLECYPTIEDFTCRVPLDRATEWNRLKISIDFVLINRIKPQMCGVAVCDFEDQKLLKDAWVNLAFAQHALTNYMTVGTMNVSVKSSSESQIPMYSDVAKWSNQFEAMGSTYLMQVAALCEKSCTKPSTAGQLNPFG
jgi:hypothetical protein